MGLALVDVRHRQHTGCGCIGAVLEHVARRIAREGGVVVGAVQRDVHDLLGRAVLTRHHKAVDGSLARAQRLQRRIVGGVGPIAVGIHRVGAVRRCAVRCLRMGLALVGVRHRQHTGCGCIGAVLEHVARRIAREGGVVVGAVQRDVHDLLGRAVLTRHHKAVDGSLARAQRLQRRIVGGVGPIAVGVHRVGAVRRCAVRCLRLRLALVGVGHRQCARRCRPGAVLEHVARRITHEGGVVVGAVQRDVHDLLGGTVLAGDDEAVDRALAVAQGLQLRVVRRVGPVAVGVHGIRAVGGFARAGAGVRLACIGVRHHQRASSRQGAVFCHGAGRLTGNGRVVVGADDADMTAVNAGRNLQRRLAAGVDVVGHAVDHLICAGGPTLVRGGDGSRCTAIDTQDFAVRTGGDVRRADDQAVAAVRQIDDLDARHAAMPRAHVDRQTTARNAQRVGALAGEFANRVVCGVDDVGVVAAAAGHEVSAVPPT